MKTNQIKITNNRRYMLSSFGFLIAMVGGICSSDARNRVTAAQAFKNLVTDTHFKVAKFSSPTNYIKKKDAARDTTRKERDAVSDFFKLLFLDKTMLSKGLQNVLSVEQCIQGDNEDGQPEIIELVSVYQVMKYLTGIYRLDEDKKAKKKRRKAGINAEIFKDLSEAQSKGLAEQDYQQVYNVIWNHMAKNLSFKPYYEKDTSLQGGIKKLFSVSLQSAVTHNPGPTVKKDGDKEDREDKKEHFVMKSILDITKTRNITVPHKKQETVVRNILTKIEEEEEERGDFNIEEDDSSTPSFDKGLFVILVGGTLATALGGKMLYDSRKGSVDKATEELEEEDEDDDGMYGEGTETA